MDISEINQRAARFFSKLGLAYSTPYPKNERWHLWDEAEIFVVSAKPRTEMVEAVIGLLIKGLEFEKKQVELSARVHYLAMMAKVRKH
jgi:hypothetical protein